MTPSTLVLAAPHLSVSSSVLGSRPSSLKAGMITLSVFVASLKTESTVHHRRVSEQTAMVSISVPQLH